MFVFASALLSILALGAVAAPVDARDDHGGMFGGQRAICPHLNTQDHGYTRGFDVTGVVTEIDLTYPEVKNECDCIQECLNRPTICANYVWKFSTKASVRSGHRTCTLYSTFNLPPDVTIDYNLKSKLNMNIIPGKIDNPQAGGPVPQAFKDMNLDTVPDDEAVSGPVWLLPSGVLQC